MVQNKEGIIIKPLNEKSKLGKDFLKLYIYIKKASKSNAVVKDGIDKLTNFFKPYTDNCQIWSNEIVMKFLSFPSGKYWINGIKEVFPEMDSSIREKVPQITGMALLDFLILDNNTWVVDDLEFDDINDTFKFKRYIKQLKSE